MLLDIARVLKVEPSVLTEGAEAALISALREAATAANMAPEEIERADELAGRFPGWAEVLAASHRRIATLERTVEALSDRLTHDPQLAASVHELLSTAAAIRSTASILADEKDLERQWIDRFHANLNQDSKRLADSSRALVNYFEAGRRDGDAVTSPQDEVDAFLSRHDYHFEEVESGAQSAEEAVADDDNLRSNAAKHLARAVLERAQADARLVTVQQLTEALQKAGPDPIALARNLNVPVPVILRKPVGQMVVPRFGAACALWPLFSALSQPGQVISTPLVQLGRARVQFDCYAVAEVIGEPRYNTPPLVEASMLLLPGSTAAVEDALQVGSTCGVCPKEACPGRREPSMLTEGL